MIRSLSSQPTSEGSWPAGGNGCRNAMQSSPSDGNFRGLHWRELFDEVAGRLTACRPPGAPAGRFPHTPWWHCVLHDPYERICFWSHAVPAVLFLLLGGLALCGAVPGALPLFVYTCCTGATHLSSALTHVYPDNHLLEKVDHIGIVATIVGTVVTALMAQGHGLPRPLITIAALLLVAAFLRPVLRVAGFVLGGAAATSLYGHQILSWVMAAELVLYVTGALLFLRNAGHSRWTGCLADHHLLHYTVTLAGLLHVFYIVGAIKE